MILPVQVTFRNIKSSPEIQKDVQKEASKLDRYYSRITSCRVLLEARRRGSTNLYHVRIDLGVPGEELVIKHQPSLHKTMTDLQETKRVKRLEVQTRYKDLNATISDAFKAARRRLEDFAERQRGETKTRVAPPRGRVIKLMPDKEFGFLESPDGRQIYFHKRSVLNGHFGRLLVGAEVVYSEEAGENGPQASVVKLPRSKKAVPAQKEALKRV